MRLHGDGGGLRAGTYTLRQNERYGDHPLDAAGRPRRAADGAPDDPRGPRDARHRDARTRRARASRRRPTAAAARARASAGRATARPATSGSAWRASCSRRPTRSRKPVSATRLVQQQLTAFQRAAATVDFRAAAKKNLTRYDVLIIASMIEREAAYPADRAKIAAVIYNRLHANMPLGIDATIQYRVGSWRVLNGARPARHGRATTRARTAACRRRRSRNPGLASLKAAAHPAKVPYLYYVAIPGDPKRRHHFSRTFADFQHFQQTHPA